MLRLEHVSKIYQTSEVRTAALDAICLEVPQGQFLAIMGPSGCGKSTLLNILGMIDAPTAGRYWFMDEDIARCTEKELTVRRRASVGFVFQNFNLIDDLDVTGNVDVGLLYRRASRADRRRLVGAALERVSLTHRAKHRPSQLSGGQQQRVAVARALVGEPKLILADEPTGNLDTANGEAVMKMLATLARGGTTVVMVTHSKSHAARADRVISMLDGRLAPR